jgi:hypothetical protein
LKGIEKYIQLCYYYAPMSETLTWSSSAATGFYAPDGTGLTERWWKDLTPPAEHPELSINGSFLRQVVQNEPGGKQSCFLTSTLNALVASNQLSATEAERMQATLVADEEGRYVRHWRPLNGSHFLGWNEDPAQLAFFVRQEVGVTVALEHIFTADPVDRVARRLREGHAAVLLGKSIRGPHARVAFEPQGQEYAGQIYIHDPKYEETTGLYPLAELAKFQLAKTASIF